jgi:hypothetical protein
MFVMDANEYRRLLSAFHEQVKLLDTNAARVTAKWLHTLDNLLSSGQERNLLFDHLSKVSRTVPAIVILVLERTSLEPLSEARKLIKAAETAVLNEIGRLQKEIRCIDNALMDRGLDIIIGEFMSSVEFVMDYIQLHFNGSTLTAYTCPDVHIAINTIRPTESGYRDTLCNLIGATVERTEIRENDCLRIIFTESRVITISLRPEDAVGPESVEFWSIHGGYWSW